MRKPVKQSPPVRQRHVQEFPLDRQDNINKGGDKGHHNVADKDQGVPPVNEADGTVSAPVEKEVDLTKVISMFQPTLMKVGVLLK